MSIYQEDLSTGTIIQFKSHKKDFHDDDFIIMETTSNRWGIVAKVLSCRTAEEFIFQEVQPTGDHYLDLIQNDVDNEVSALIHYQYDMTVEAFKKEDKKTFEEIQWECHDEVCEANPVIYTLHKEHDEWKGSFNDFDPRYPHLISSINGEFHTDGTLGERGC